MKAKDVDEIIREILKIHVQEVNKLLYYPLCEDIIYENTLKELGIEHIK